MRLLPKKNFFLLVLSASLLIVAVTTVGLVNSNPTVANSSAKTDRYFAVPFGPKGTPDASWNSAKKLLKLLVSNKITPQAVLRYNGTAFVALTYYGTHEGVDYFDGDDFPIKVGEAYQLNLINNRGASLDRVLKFSAVGTLNYNLTTGWQMLSIPQGVLKKLTNYRALQLCRDIKKDDGNAIEVALQESSHDGSSIKSTSFKCANMDGENFKIESGDAVFVEVSTNSVLSLP